MSESSPRRPDGDLRYLLVPAVLLALSFNLWSLTRFWNENFRDAYESRQYQTALTARYLQQDGLRLAYETPVLGPPWSIPMEFPFYQAIVAKISTATGLRLEPTGRLVSVLAFYACLPAVWILLRKRLPQSDDRLVVIAMVLLSPLYLFYSRNFMIESTALCLSLWFLAAFDAALSRPASWLLPAAWLAGALGATTKITTFAMVCLPAVAIVVQHAWQRRKPGLSWAQASGRPLLVAAIVASIPVVAGWVWVTYSDHVKELNPYGRILTSSSLREFNFGTVALRFTWKYWQSIGYHSSQHITTLPGLLLLVVGIFLVSASYRRIALICLGCYCVGFLTFANLYYVHDYYYYASAVFLVTAVGSVGAGLLQASRFRRGIRLFGVAGVLMSQPLAFLNSYGGFYHRQNLPVPSVVEVIKAATRPTDVFAALDFDWNPMIPYGAQRRAIMVFQSHTENKETFAQAVNNLKPDKVAALLVGNPHRQYPKFLEPWLNELEMELQPIASTEEGDLYVRGDLLFDAAVRLKGKKFRGVTLHLPQPLSGSHNLTDDTWPARLTMVRPAPLSSRGEFAIGIVDLNGEKVISTQAPTEILVKAPSGAKRIQARCGMLPGSYQNGNTTDGVILEIHEERLDGTIRTLFRRALQPLTLPADRQEIVIDYTQDTPLEGTLVFGCYPGPARSAAFDWVYWRDIEVH